MEICKNSVHVRQKKKFKLSTYCTEKCNDEKYRIVSIDRVNTMCNNNNKSTSYANRLFLSLSLDQSKTRSYPEDNNRTNDISDNTTLASSFPRLLCIRKYREYNNEG